ncbi:thiamine pyrophosphate-binding protein [Roseomonas terrae]|jgi:acetolactate synthase-1/2/3 large subunit|uniref:Thiamine pyrophosphate-binding protein n=1 Tax=Neoroseomonas terrae TaxID=424799 RepID=A0ABS5EMW8_9PROT|nr:thiamine pyrophosphate-binding protein [Neoroseomonas terrae]MBR0652380.1 thiamine pyrophosphate-binding protein [Neoroseomonas terrae]
MNSPYTVADLVADILPQIGVRTVFGIVSVHNIPMLDAIGRRNALRYVMARGEMGGAHMADAYARVVGHLGVLFTSTGPGMANAIPGLVEARFAGSPVLHITGQTATKHIDRDAGTVHDVPGQTAMLAAACKAAYRVRSANEAFGVLVRAAAEALSAPRGPVSVEIPIDLQRAPIARPAALDGLVLPIAAPLPPSPAALDAAAEILAGAKRPMLWLGNGAKQARDAALRLMGLGFGAVSSWNGRGTIPEDHPMTLGGLHGNGSTRVQDFYGSVDAMLVVGSRLRGHETGDFSMKLPKTLIHVDSDPAADGRTYGNSLFVHGDAGLVMAGIADRLAGRSGVDAGYAADFAAMKSRAREEYLATLGPYAGFPDAIRAALPRDGVFVRDITIANSTWGNRVFPIFDPKDSVYPVGAAIGPGLALGLGASIAAEGRKTLAMVGDGGFSLGMCEIFTAAQEKPDLVTMVMNDGGYGVIRHIQDAVADGRQFGDNLLTPELQGLATLAGLPYFRVSSAETVGEVVSQAVAVKGPALVEVDMRAIGPVPPYAPYATMGKHAERARQ